MIHYKPNPVLQIVAIVLLFSCGNTIEQQQKEQLIEPPPQPGNFYFQTNCTYKLTPDNLALHAKIMQWAPFYTDTATTDSLSYYEEPLPHNKIQNQYLLKTNRGQQLKIETDGKKLWMDAASTVFIGYQTQQLHSVSIANANLYYEAEKDSLIIDLLTDSLQVRGTPGSIVAINNYENEPNINITLIKGKLHITGKYNHKRIQITLNQPGQQILINRTNGNLTPAQIDADDLPQWEKTTIYRLAGADMQTILRTAERWYSMPVVYKDSLPHVVMEGSLLYLSPVTSVLKLLEANAPIKCQIINDTIVVALIKK